MKAILPRSRSRRADALRRAQLLQAFDSSGLSSAAFARQHGLAYATFCGWRHRRAKASATVSPAFVEVEVRPPAPVHAPAAGDALVVELGSHARLRVASARQAGLAACLIHAFDPAAPC